MLREIVKIDRDKCNGCGVCVPSCHEGALQMIDGKATLVSELMCDGLGACVGECPVGAIIIEKREAQPYDEVTTLQEMIPNGKNVIIAHLKHLKEHGQTDFLKQGVTFLKSNEHALPFNLAEVIHAVHNHHGSNGHNHDSNGHHHHGNGHHHAHHHAPEPQSNQFSVECGCPGSKTMAFKPRVQANDLQMTAPQVEQQSELAQWPVQMHLVNPMAPYFKNADLLVAADCIAFAVGNFHQKYLKGRSLAIACPKLDSHTEIYVDKITRLIDEARINTLNVMIMEVPCCRGLLQMVQAGAKAAQRKVPVKLTVVGIQGEIKMEEWV